MDVLEALGEMRAERRSVALVVDEHGGVAGILSLKDLLEPLVGDLTDELAGTEEPEVVRVDAERWLVDGQITIDDLDEAIGLAPPRGRLRDPGRLPLRPAGPDPRRGRRSSRSTAGASRSRPWTSAASTRCWSAACKRSEAEAEGMTDRVPRGLW